MTTKGYAQPTSGKLIHHLIKKGYTKAHQKNSKSAKFKGWSHAVSLHSGRVHGQPPSADSSEKFTTEDEVNE